MINQKNQNNFLWFFSPRTLQASNIKLQPLSTSPSSRRKATAISAVFFWVSKSLNAVEIWLRGSHGMRNPARQDSTQSWSNISSRRCEYHTSWVVCGGADYWTCQIASSLDDLRLDFFFFGGGGWVETWGCSYGACYRDFRFQDCLMLNPKMTQFDIIDVWFCSYEVATNTFVCLKRYVFSMIRFFEFVVMALYEDVVLKLPLPTARPIMTHGRNIWMTIPRSGTLHLESLEHIGALYRVQNLSVSFHNCAVFLIGLVL